MPWRARAWDFTRTGWTPPTRFRRASPSRAAILAISPRWVDTPGQRAERLRSLPAPSIAPTAASRTPRSPAYSAPSRTTPQPCRWTRKSAGKFLGIRTENNAERALLPERQPLEQRGGRPRMRRRRRAQYRAQPFLAPLHHQDPRRLAPGIHRTTGLGLSTVYGIVRLSGGGVVAESAPGAGGTFRIYLKRDDGALERSAGDRAAASRGPGRRNRSCRRGRRGAAKGRL
jgi:hypothetical protein